MSSPNISFFSIPSNIRKPGVYFEENTNNALQGLTAPQDKICLLAQKLSTGSVASKTPTVVFSDADSALYFGTGSVAHLATKAMFESNPNISLTVCAIDDAGGGTQAAGSFAITGTATAAGSLQIWIGDVGVSVGVSVGDANTTVATNLGTALSAVSNLLPVTYAVVSNAINLTARHKGTLGNQSTLSYALNTVTGTGVTLTQLTGGASDPDVGVYSSAGTVLAAVVAGGYTIFCSTLPDASNLGKIKSMVAFASGAMEQRPAVWAAGATEEVDTYSNIKTLAGTTMNDGRGSIAWITYANGGNNQAKSEPWKVGAEYAAMLSYNSDPVVPFDGLALATIAPPSVVDRMTRTQSEDALNNGVTPLEVVPGNEVTIVRAISTYTTTASIPDPTLLDITTVRTLDYVRAQIRTRLALRFIRAKLSTKTPARVVSQVLDVLYLLEQLEIVQNVAQYKAGVIAEIDTQTQGQIDVKVPANVVQGLHVIAGVVDLILG